MFWPFAAKLAHSPRAKARCESLRAHRAEPFSRIVAASAVLGVTGIIATWWVGGDGWESLLSSLVGLAAAGGIVWLVRIIGRYALRKEAMGFGDVTLMAMIGSFLGWQACLFVFFLAPFAGLLLGIANWICAPRTRAALRAVSLPRGIVRHCAMGSDLGVGLAVLLDPLAGARRVGCLHGAHATLVERPALVEGLVSSECGVLMSIFAGNRNRL